MRLVLKWIGFFAAGVVSLVLAVGVYIYVASARILARTYAAPTTDVAVPTDSASILLGSRLAATRGCTGCHGADAQGQVVFDEPWVARIVAPNLTAAVQERSDAELERIIRHGVFPDGHSTLAMPSSMFYFLSDEDLGAILAYLRSLPTAEGPQTEIDLGPLARLGVVLGQYDPQASLIDNDAPRRAVDPADTLAYGRYLARTACTECHGLDLEGGLGGRAPDLAIAASYSDADFARLMRTGEARGGRELDLMSPVAQGRFSHFTDAEIQVLHSFLVARVAPHTAAGRDSPSQ